jgi:hypothetical protein
MPVTTQNKPPPARDYPNINAVQAIRYDYDSTPINTGFGIQTPSALLKLNTPVLFGTIPGKSLLFGSTICIQAPTIGAATLDVGTLAAPTRFGSGFLLNAKLIDDDFITNAGYIGDADTPICLTLKGASDLSGSIFSVLLYYYSKFD